MVMHHMNYVKITSLLKDGSCITIEYILICILIGLFFLKNITQSSNRRHKNPYLILKSTSFHDDVMLKLCSYVAVYILRTFI